MKKRLTFLIYYLALVFLLASCMSQVPKTNYQLIIKEENIIEYNKDIDYEKENKGTKTNLKLEEVFCVRVKDGDTIVIRDIAGNIFNVRYIGMNTPERGDDYFIETTLANKMLVNEKKIKLEKDVSETDKWGRLLRYVYVGDIFVNAKLVADGFAQVATYPPDVKYSEHFLELQREAIEAKRGLWGIEDIGDVSEASDDCKYLGSINSNIYHYPYCEHVETIKQENIIWFVDSEDARSKEYRPCKKCCPP
jgi:micrococcal nuclease